MKKLLFIIAIAFTCTSFAADKKEYGFKFVMKNDKYEYKQNANSYEEAFEKAAMACYQHYKDGRHLAEEQGLDIIDVCANPRAI